jgi:hypothetical protein
MRCLCVLLALCIVGCGWSPHRPPGPTPTARTEHPGQTYTSSDGVHFHPGPGRDTKHLRPVTWQTVNFKNGRVTLGELIPFTRVRGTCGRPVLVHVGPAQGAFRVITAWSEPTSAGCRRGHEHIVLSPAGWTRDTVATPQPLQVPDPHLTNRQESTALPGSAVLQPDRRTIVVSYGYGGCSALAGVSARRDGSVVTVSVRTGVDPALDKDVACPMILVYGTTAVQLPEPAPPETTLKVAR